MLRGYRQRLAQMLEDLQLEGVASIIEHLHDAWKRRALIVIAGNGGSAATASHMATDLVKATRVTGRPAVRAVSLMDNVSLLSALANDDGYEVALVRQLDAIFRSGDVLVLISASGNSENLVGAAREAKALGGSTVAFVGFDGGRLAEECDLCVCATSPRGLYGPVEDIHLILNHMLAEGLLRRILGEDASSAADL